MYLFSSGFSIYMYIRFVIYVTNNTNHMHIYYIGTPESIIIYVSYKYIDGKMISAAFPSLSPSRPSVRSTLWAARILIIWPTEPKCLCFLMFYCSITQLELNWPTTIYCSWDIYIFDTGLVKY